MATLDLTPEVVDLKLYAGDDPILGLTVWQDATKTQALDLTNYYSWAATIRSTSGATSSVTVTVIDALHGKVTLQFVGSTVRPFPSRGNLWDLRVFTPDAREITLIRGRVVVLQDVTT